MEYLLDSCGHDEGMAGDVGLNFERYVPTKKRRRDTIPWSKMNVGENWIVMGCHSEQLKAYALRHAPKVFAHLKCMNGNVITRTV